MEELELFNYRNLFPLNRATSFVLTLMYLCPFPFSKTSLLCLLKPLYSDKEAASQINNLVREGYIHTKNGLYALSSKSVKGLDIHKEKLPHRKKTISIENTFVYEIKSFIVAQELVNSVMPIIQNNGHWPKNEKERTKIIHHMISQIQNKVIPFVKGYNVEVYSNSLAKTKYLREYDINSLYLSKLYAKLNASAIIARTNPQEVENYERIYKELNQVKATLKKITPLCQMLTYTDNIKVLTLSILEQNGMFIESIDDSIVAIGLINSATSYITNYRLRKKLDYAVTFASTLGLTLSVSIYTDERTKLIIENRIKKLNAPFDMPSITIKPIPERLPSRTEYLKRILREQ